MCSPVIGDASKALSTGIGYFWKLKKKNTHPHKVYANIIFACPHQNAIKNDRNMISDVFLMYDIIVFENLCFCPSTRKQKAGVFKDFNPGEHFWKDAFSVIVFTRYLYVWTVGQTGEKIMSVFKQKHGCGCCVHCPVGNETPVIHC